MPLVLAGRLAHPPRAARYQPTVLCCAAVLCCAGLQKLMRELDAARAAHEEEVAVLKEEVAAAKRRETAAQAEATAKVGRRGDASGHFCGTCNNGC